MNSSLRSTAVQFLLRLVTGNLLSIRYPGCRHHFRCQGCMQRLVVKEYVGAECLQNFFLTHPAQKKHFVDTYIPCAKSPDHSLMRRCTSGCHKSGSDRRFLCRTIFLQFRQQREESGERPCLKRIVGIAPFILLKRFESLFLEDLLRFIRKQYCIPVKSYADLPYLMLESMALCTSSS